MVTAQLEESVYAESRAVAVKELAYVFAGAESSDVPTGCFPRDHSPKLVELRHRHVSQVVEKRSLR